jgi:hypothetical protein
MASQKMQAATTSRVEPDSEIDSHELMRLYLFCRYGLQFVYWRCSQYIALSFTHEVNFAGFN